MEYRWRNGVINQSIELYHTINNSDIRGKTTTQPNQHHFNNGLGYKVGNINTEQVKKSKYVPSLMLQQGKEFDLIILPPS